MTHHWCARLVLDACLSLHTNLLLFVGLLILITFPFCSWARESFCLWGSFCAYIKLYEVCLVLWLCCCVFVQESSTAVSSPAWWPRSEGAWRRPRGRGRSSRRRSQPVRIRAVKVRQTLPIRPSPPSPQCQIHMACGGETTRTHPSEYMLWFPRTSLQPCVKAGLSCQCVPFHLLPSYPACSTSRMMAQRNHRWSELVSACGIGTKWSFFHWLQCWPCVSIPDWEVSTPGHVSTFGWVLFS